MVRSNWPVVAAVFLSVWLPPVSSQGEGFRAQETRSTRLAAHPLKDPAFFPIGVWLQNPRNAPAYKKAGFNLYVGLWKGPTARQLEQLKRAGMFVICHQNNMALRHPDRQNIIGWLHRDEPDNAQRRALLPGYNPPVSPAALMTDYQKILSTDNSRPVMLNLGQGVAWDGWRGRGIRTNHPEDYPKYIGAADIVSFDIYPVGHPSAVVAGKLEYVARGVKRLLRWASEGQVVWNIVGASGIKNPDVSPTPPQIRSQVWMSLIHGSRGIIYFVHRFKPRFVEASLLSEPELLRAVTEINRQIKELVPVLNSQPLRGKLI